MDFLAKDINEEIKEESNDTWKVLIVDDEPEVHILTQLTLKDFIFKNKKIEFTSAYSEKECKDILLKNQNFNIILLDVVLTVN